MTVKRKTVVDIFLVPANPLDDNNDDVVTQMRSSVANTSLFNGNRTNFLLLRNEIARRDSSFRGAHQHGTAKLGSDGDEPRAGDLWSSKDKVLSRDFRVQYRQAAGILYGIVQLYGMLCYAMLCYGVLSCHTITSWYQVQYRYVWYGTPIRYGTKVETE